MTRNMRPLSALAALLALATAAWADTGGPDGGGYVFVDSADPANPAAPAFAFVPLVGGTDVLSSGGGPLLSDDDDGVSPAVPIGFNFTYYGGVFTQVIISSNGYVTFGDTTNEYRTQSVPNLFTPNGILAVNFADLDPSSSLTDSIRTLTAGAAPNRTFTIEWLDVPHFGGLGAPCRVQAILFETTNEIVMQLDDATADDNPPFGAHEFTSIGIEDTTGVNGLQYLAASPAGLIADNVAVRFMPTGLGARCAGTGGPDGFGYRYVDSTATGIPTAPVFNFVPIGTNNVLAGGTPMTAAAGNNLFSDVINLGFTFNFYGNNFTQVFLCDNGFLSFVADNTGARSHTIPTAGTPQNAIFVNWNDLDQTVAASPVGSLSFATAGVAPNRTFTAEWLGIQHAASNRNPIRVQVRLFETSNEILMQLDDATSDGSFTTIGIENATGAIGLEYFTANNNATVIDNRAVLFSPTRDLVAPAAVRDLAAANPSASTVDLTWSEPGDDCLVGSMAAPSASDVRWSTSPILSQADFLAANAVVGPVPTGPPGNPVAFTVTALPGDSLIFFAVEYLDEAGNRGLLSNVASGTTLDTVAPGQVVDLRITNIVGTLVTVTWTNTGDNGNVGTATTLDFRMRTGGCVSLVAADFNPPFGAPPVGVTDIPGEPAPTAAGTTQSFTFDMGAPFTQFSVALMVYDEVPLNGPVSNQPVCGVTGAPVWAPVLPGSDSGGGISNTAAYSVDPCMDVNPLTNQPGVVWTDRDTVGGDLEIFMRENNGAAFAELALSGSGGGLSNNGSPSQFSDIAYDALGQPVVAWQDVDAANGDADIFVRRFEAGAWVELAGSATGSGVSANNSSSTGPSVEINPLTGQPGVAWVDFSLGDFEIFFREFDPAAVPAPAWVQRANSGQNQGVSNNTGVSLQPSLAYDALGRPVIAWADNTSGNYEIYVRRFNPALFPPAWEELAGSGTGGGISLSPTQVSQNPSIQIGFGDNPFVIWQETLPTGNFEIYGRRFDGVNWVDFGPGSAVNGGISITPGRSITPELCIVPGFFDVFFAVWADFSDPQGDWEIYGKWFDNGQWRELGTFSTRLGGISNTAGHSVSPCCGVGGGRAFVSWQEFSGGNYEVFVRSLLLLGPVADSNHEFVVGGGTGARGEYRVFDNGTTVPPYLPLELRAAPFAAGYNANVGVLHPACGDVDGDGLDEVILGQGPFPGGTGGFVAVMRDHTGRYDQLAMLRFPWTAYNNANGTVYPAAGDVDGDGRDEIVMGMGTFAGGGYFAVFDDQIGLFGFLRFVRAGFPSYNSLNGELHPACGDVDADGVDEIIVGLGRGGAGVATVRDDLLRNFVGLGAFTYPNSAYNSANGTTWPSCGNLTGGLGAETVIGPGKGGSGLLYIYGDRALGFARVGGLQFPWSAYNTSSGEVRPAVGNLDPDLALEVVAGTGPFSRGPLTPNLFVFNNVTTGAGAAGTFVLYANTNANYNRNNGETFPATGQLR